MATLGFSIKSRLERKLRNTNCGLCETSASSFRKSNGNETRTAATLSPDCAVEQVKQLVGEEGGEGGEGRGGEERTNEGRKEEKEESNQEKEGKTKKE